MGSKYQNLQESQDIAFSHTASHLVKKKKKWMAGLGYDIYNKME